MDRLGVSLQFLGDFIQAISQERLYVQKKHFVLHQNHDRKQLGKSTGFRIHQVEAMTQHVAPMGIPEEHQSTCPFAAGTDLAADASEGSFPYQFDRFVDDRDLAAYEVGIAVRVLADQTDAVADRVAGSASFFLAIEVDVQQLDVGFAQGLRAEHRSGTMSFTEMAQRNNSIHL